MEASCSETSQRNISVEEIETPPNEVSRNQSTTSEIEETIITKNISTTPNLNTNTESIQGPLDDDTNEKENELDRRKSTSPTGSMRDEDLERLEREDFSKEDALIFTNHSLIENINEQLSKITNNDSKPSTSSEILLETEKPFRSVSTSTDEQLTTTPSRRYSWNSGPRPVERLSVGAKLNLSATLNRVANEAGPSCARTSHDGPSGSKQGTRLNKSDSNLEVIRESRFHRYVNGVSHLDIINLNGIVDIENKHNRSVDDINNDSTSSKFRKSDDKLNKTNNVSDIKGNANEQRLTDPPAEVDILEAREIEIEYEDETWADCEEGSDEEEVCTCMDYVDSSENEENSTEEEELPSRDVDLSAFTEMETITQEELLQESHNMAISGEPNDISRTWRKRKLEKKYPEEFEVKKLALDPTQTPKNLYTYSPASSCNSGAISRNSGGSSSKSNTHLPKTPRSVIPTKDNPPPELTDWLLQFQRWSHVERILAIDRLIERCEPTQIRHMMQVIEPQFQRDFISLLPKEVALSVLSFLEPKDLLRAAQTCRSWRFLADDNLLWKKKCNAAGIAKHKDYKRAVWNNKLPFTSSPWKLAYMRQHIIETNWRMQPIRLPKVLKGHDDHVITCLQFSGNRIVSGSDDNTLKVWSAVTGKCLRTLVGHTGGVWSSQMNGNIVISGSTDRTLKVWDADTGDCTHTLYGHTSTVRCMHLHGDKVVSGSRDATLRVWDIAMGSCLHVLVGHLAAVRCVQYDGKLVVSGAYDYMVKVWNPEREECLHTLQGHTNRVYSLQFDGIHVVSGSLDTSIRVWDVESGSCRHTLMGHQSLTSGMELRDNILVSGNADSTVKVWDIVTGQCLQTLSGPHKHQSAVTCLQFNSRFVITSSDDGTVKLWDVKTGEFIRNLVALASGGSGGVVWRIRANETKLICAVGSRNGTEETKLMVLDFDVEGACAKCS